MEVKEADNIIKKYIPEISKGGLSILDVGCREGTFLEVARGYGNDVLGIEHRRKYWDDLKSKSINYITADISDIPYPIEDDVYDVVVCAHSFSQIKDVSKWDLYLSDYARIARKVVLVLANKGEQFDQYKHLLDGWKNHNWCFDKNVNTVYMWKNVNVYGSLVDKIHIGKRGFVIGGGESINTLIKNGLDIKKLLRNEITIGTNRSYLLGTSTYHTAMDPPYFREDADKLFSLNTNLLVTDMIGHEYSDSSKLTILKRVNYKGSNIISESFADGIYYGKSTGYIAMNVAHVLGLNPIYLLGLDLVGYHFHKGYGKSKDSKLHKDHANIEKEFRNGIKELGIRGTKVISLSSISVLNDIISYNPNILEEYGWSK